jgi:hypothetical protein
MATMNVCGRVYLWCHKKYHARIQYSLSNSITSGSDDDNVDNKA